MIPRNQRSGMRFASSIFLAGTIISVVAVAALVAGTFLTGCDGEAYASSGGGGPFVSFEVCKIDPGDAVKHDGGTYSGRVWVSSEAVSIMEGMEGVDKGPCTMLRTEDGKTVYVRGTPDSIACRLRCEHDCNHSMLEERNAP